MRNHVTFPAVSVCIPVYQAEQYLAETLGAVLAQTFADMEVVVLDNNSTDGSSRILRSIEDPRVRMVRNDVTLPMPDNWNRLVSHCRGGLIKLVCADDLIDRECVAAQAEILLTRPEIALVACRTDLIDDSGRILRRSTGLRGLTGTQSRTVVNRRIVRSGGNPIGPAAAVMFRKADFDAVGGFDGNLLYPMDLELWSRLVNRGGFVGDSYTGASFRVSGSSLTALTSASSQLRQQVELMRRITCGHEGDIGVTDRVIGRLSSFTMQARRTALYWRANRRLRALEKA